MAPRSTRITCLATIAFASASASAQEERRAGLWGLFWESFDLFSIVLIAGSILAVALVVRAVLDIRRAEALSARAAKRLAQLARDAQTVELIDFARKDGSIASSVVAAAADAPSETPAGMRERAEVVAGERCASWYRRVEPLNLIGNLGPLVGLAGTVWGMILAFQGLGAAGGQANPGVLSLGISKALFHTLLGLLLAIPSLAAYGVLRARVDRLCNDAMVVSSRAVEMLIQLRAETAVEPRPSTEPAAKAAKAGRKRPNDAA